MAVQLDKATPRACSLRSRARARTLINRSDVPRAFSRCAPSANDFHLARGKLEKAETDVLNRAARFQSSKIRQICKIAVIGRSKRNAIRAAESYRSIVPRAIWEAVSRNARARARALQREPARFGVFVRAPARRRRRRRRAALRPTSFPARARPSGPLVPDPSVAGSSVFARISLFVAARRSDESRCHAGTHCQKSWQLLRRGRC